MPLKRALPVLALLLFLSSSPLPPPASASFWAYPASPDSLHAQAGDTTLAFLPGAVAFDGFTLQYTSSAVPEGRSPYTGALHLLHGAEPAAWQTGLPIFRSIAYPELYPGIDLTWTWAGARLKSTFVLDTGADPAAIRWSYNGATPRLDPSTGDLVLSLPCAGPDCEVREHAPLAWQIVGKDRVPVPAAFSLSPDGSLSFTLGAYDPARPLVIDPTYTLDSEIAGPGQVLAARVALAPDGRTIVAGQVRDGGLALAGLPGSPNGSGGLALYDPADNSLSSFSSSLDPLGVTEITASPADPELIFAATQTHGIYRSDDGGATWTPANDGIESSASDPPEYAPVNYIAPSPFDADEIFAGIGSSGMYRSTDGGLTWGELDVDFVVGRMTRLVFDPVRPGTLFGASTTTLQRSTDGGATWEQIRSGNAASCLAAGSDGSLYFCDYYSLYGSRDGGDTWEALFTDYDHGLYAAAVDPADPQRVALFISGNAGEEAAAVLLSENGGNSFEIIATLPYHSIARYTLHFDGAPGGDLLVGTEYGWMVFSPDGEPRVLAGDLPPSHEICCAAAAVDGRTLVLTRPQWDAFVLARTPDGGDIDYVVYLGGGGDDTVGGLEVGPDGDVYLAGTTRSLDFPILDAYAGVNVYGQGAFLARLGPDGVPIFSTYYSSRENGWLTTNALALDGQGRPILAGELIFARKQWNQDISDRAFVVRFSPDEASVDLERLIGGNDNHISIYTDAYAVTVDAADNVFIAGETNSAAFPLIRPLQDTYNANKTSNPFGGDGFIIRIDNLTGEVTWSTYLGGDGADIIQALAFRPDGSLALAGTTYSGALPGAEAGIQPKPAGGIFALGPEGAFEPRSAGLPRRNITSIAIDPNDPRNMIAFVSRYGLYYSSDSGETWNGPALNLDYAEMTLAAADGWMAAAGYDALYLSRDGGRTWEPTAWERVVGFSVPRALVLLPGNQLRILATHYGQGMVYSDFGGASYRQPEFPDVAPYEMKTIRVSATDPELVFAIGDFTAYRSTDGGRTWTALAALEYPTDLFPDPIDPQVVHGWSGIYETWSVSTDQGDTWEVLHESDFSPTWLQPDAAETGVFYATDLDGGLFVSRDIGASWEPVAAFPGAAVFHVYGPDPSIVHAAVPQSQDGFVSVVDVEANTILWTTYVGGVGHDDLQALAVDSGGDLYLGGSTSFGFPLVDSWLASPAGGTDAFVAKLAGNGDAWLYASLLGGEAQDSVDDLAVLADGTLFLAGSSWVGGPREDGAGWSLETGSAFSAVLLDATPAPTSEPSATPLPATATETIPATEIPAATGPEPFETGTPAGEGPSSSGDGDPSSGCGAGAFPLLLVPLVWLRRTAVRKRSTWI